MSRLNRRASIPTSRDETRILRAATRRHERLDGHPVGQRVTRLERLLRHAIQAAADATDVTTQVRAEIRAERIAYLMRLDGMAHGAARPDTVTRLTRSTMQPASGANPDPRPTATWGVE